MLASRSKGDGIMCEEWWDERLLREQAEKLRRASKAPAPTPEPETADKPQPKPQQQPDPVPV
jgi:hypothetical protein